MLLIEKREQISGRETLKLNIAVQSGASGYGRGRIGNQVKSLNGPATVTGQAGFSLPLAAYNYASLTEARGRLSPAIARSQETCLVVEPTLPLWQGK